MRFVILISAVATVVTATESSTAAAAAAGSAPTVTVEVAAAERADVDLVDTPFPLILSLSNSNLLPLPSPLPLPLPVPLPVPLPLPLVMEEERAVLDRLARSVLEPVASEADSTNSIFTSAKAAGGRVEVEVETRGDVSRAIGNKPPLALLTTLVIRLVIDFHNGTAPSAPLIILLDDDRISSSLDSLAEVIVSDDSTAEVVVNWSTASVVVD